MGVVRGQVKKAPLFDILDNHGPSSHCSFSSFLLFLLWGSSLLGPGKERRGDGRERKGAASKTVDDETKRKPIEPFPRPPLIRSVRRNTTVCPRREEGEISRNHRKEDSK
jgi:hypothetical protein